MQKLIVRRAFVYVGWMPFPTSSDHDLLTLISRRQEALIKAVVQTAQIASITNTELANLVAWMKEQSDKPPLIDVVLELFAMVRELQEGQVEILKRLG